MAGILIIGSSIAAGMSMLTSTEGSLGAVAILGFVAGVFALR